jgi:hypothetical protein
LAIPLLVGLAIAGGAAAAAATASAVGSANAAAAQKSAAEKAMDQQKKMYDERRSDALKMYNQSRADQAPWLQAGQQSLSQMLQMATGGFDSSQLANDPGFQFRMEQGQRALERSASARGGLNSGAAMKSLARYSQGLASEEFGNRFNRLGAIAGMGHSSAQNLGGLSGQFTGQQNAFGSHFADAMSDLHGAFGNAEAGGHMGVSNAVAGGFRDIGNLAMLGTGYGGGGGGGGMGGMMRGMGGMSVPTQGASTGYMSNTAPSRFGFGGMGVWNNPNRRQDGEWNQFSVYGAG